MQKTYPRFPFPPQSLPYRNRHFRTFLYSRTRRKDTEASRKKLIDDVNQEIDMIVREMHAKLSRSQANSIGIAYARYSSEFQHSIADQIRRIYEDSIRRGIFIPRELVFDLAVRRCQERRDGLDQVREILEKRSAQVLLVFTTNRLYRKGYKAMKFVEEEIVERGLLVSS